MAKSVDEILSDVQPSRSEKQWKIIKEVDDRKKSALRRIAEAAVVHGLGNSRDLETQLRRRLRAAQEARVSEAEALATMAERLGDFSTSIEWVELRIAKAVVYKGYCRNNVALTFFDYVSQDGRIRDRSGVRVSVHVRRGVTGVYVAALYHGKSLKAVGRSEESAGMAANTAYLAYYGLEEEDLPTGLWGVDKTDR